ncbi:antibiotic biosynthesis monooxygenase [Marmoricola endophyticus]|uniref:Antibiotic biosynthesis monooxygenase n=1 Tax=Marmoricola endophyticus TaxID=2040280 RepID=A0A917BJU6_9ACTN|nr:putative quinol monooxygenase [Marmoricola endophyticus]GGF46841.1 antibiotic biosynthesis monooxygenase [Marmoricola endophyticus]
MSELHVVATIPVKPEHVDELRPLISELAVETNKEEGCLSYEARESASAPGVFVTVERWRSQDDLDAHMQTPHIAKALGALEGKAAGEVAIHPLGEAL